MTEKENKEFLEDKITITRDEFSDILGIEIANIQRGMVSRAEKRGEEPDDEMIGTFSEMLIAFGANIMTKLFDESKVGNLEITEEGEDL